MQESQSETRNDPTLLLKPLQRSDILPLYKTIVRPLIENSSPAWTPWLQHDINNLDKVQKRCLKLCTNHIEIEHLSTRRQKADMKETYKQVHGLYKNRPLLTPMDTQYVLRGHSKIEAVPKPVQDRNP